LTLNSLPLMMGRARTR